MKRHVVFLITLAAAKQAINIRRTVNDTKETELGAVKE